ncbi:MAG: Ku protein [Akkermansiaceae bacterium]
MARAIWKGSIAFGLVNIPVGLVGAETRPDIQLHMVDSQNHARIRYERVNADTGEEVPWDRLVKGYEHDDGQFILLTDEDLQAVQPKLTKTIEISEFVSLDDIDPMLFDKPYYLEPDKRGRKAYALLREALRGSGKAGISRVVIRTREYLSAMFVREDALILMLLRFPQEIRSAAKLDLPSATDKEWQPVKKELDLALRLIGEMTGKWQPEEFHDEYRENLMDFIERKIAGGESVADVKKGDEEGEEKGGKVLDLAEYLERSIKKPAGEATPDTKKKPASKNATKKSAGKKANRTA